MMPDKMFPKLFLVMLAYHIGAALAINCAKDCAQPDFSNPQYKPQECAKFCKEGEAGRGRFGQTSSQYAGLQARIESLTSLVMAVLVLVILMLAALLFFLFKNSGLSNSILKLWTPKNKLEVTTEKAKETRLNMTEPVISSKKPSPPPPLEIIANKRTRNPSESTCHEETDVVEVNGYDNYGMSSSTLNTHSPPSSPSSPVTPATTDGDMSMTIFNTTTTTVHLDSPRCSPNQSPRSQNRL